MLLEKTETLTDGMLLLRNELNNGLNKGWNNYLYLLVGLDKKDCDIKLANTQNDVAKGLIKSKRSPLNRIKAYAMPIIPVLAVNNCFDFIPSALPYISDCIQYKMENNANDIMLYAYEEPVQKVFCGYRVNKEVFQLYAIKRQLTDTEHKLYNVESYLSAYDSIFANSGKIKKYNNIIDYLSMQSNYYPVTEYCENEIYFSIGNNRITVSQYLGNDTWLNLGYMTITKERMTVSKHFMDISYHRNRKEIRQYRPKVQLYRTNIDVTTLF